MLDAVLRWSIRNRLVVVLVWTGVIIAGVVSFRSLPLDAYPDITPVQVQVNTVVPALSPIEIERQVTARVEQAISGMTNLSEVRSLSRFGLSQVTATFADGMPLPPDFPARRPSPSSILR